MDYLITFTPTAPYFFCDEKKKASVTDGRADRGAPSPTSYARSELMPPQTAMLGALRYLLLEEKKDRFDYSPREFQAMYARIGPESFDMDAPRDKSYSFGVIRAVSPVFLMRDGHVLVPLPRDHRGGTAAVYTPFCDYRSLPSAQREDERLFAADCPAGESIGVRTRRLTGFVDADTGEVYAEDDIFLSRRRVCAPRPRASGGSVVKEYRFPVCGGTDAETRRQTSFAVYADLSADRDGREEVVFWGQGKTPFTVRFTRQKNDLAERVRNLLCRTHRLPYDLIYCLGDAIVFSDPGRHALFAATAVREHFSCRSSRDRDGQSGENRGGKTEIHRLLRAGSVLICRDASVWKAEHAHPAGEKIGYNLYIVVEGENHAGEAL